jgi:hypothetical protein
MANGGREMQTRKGRPYGGDFVGRPLREKVDEVFGEMRRTQLARATADSFIRRALAYMKEHEVGASVAVDMLVTPAVIREAARGLTGALSDAALLEFARKGVTCAIEDAQSRPTRGAGRRDHDDPGDRTRDGARCD